MALFEMAFSEAEHAGIIAALDASARGVRALHRFLDVVDFEQAGGGLWRLAPILHRRAVAQAIDHPLVPRLKGVARHIWLGNELRLRALPDLLKVIGPITPVVLINTMASFVRLGPASDLRPLGPIEILVASRPAPAAFGALTAHGWHTPPCDLSDSMIEGSAPHPVVPVRQGTMDYFLAHRNLVHHQAGLGFAAGLIARAHAVRFRDHAVLVPTNADHLLMLLAQVEDYGDDRRVDRVAETALNLAAMADEIDWNHFHRLSHTYGLTGRIRDAVAMLHDEFGVAIPQALMPPSRFAAAPGLA